MRVLVACEYSGTVRDAFSRKGHDAWSCDLLPTESELTTKEGKHIQGSCLGVLDQGWDLMIGHPPCTYLAVSGACHFNKPGRREKQLEAIEFFKALYNAPIPKIALENPVDRIPTVFRKPDQYIQPYEHGHEAMKKTGLWLKGLSKLTPTNIVDKGEIWVQKDGKRRGSRWHMCLPPGPNRWKIRSKTFQGIADAMASQWATHDRN